MNARLSPQPEPPFDEVAEWIEAFNEVLAAEGRQAAANLLAAVSQHATEAGVHLPVQLNTPYVNTIPASEEEPYPGDLTMERRINALVRWNAMAMVHCQNKKDPGIGGHIST
jgi:pyruvate dehydrogenase E1 component